METKKALIQYISKLNTFNQNEINAIAESTQVELFKKGTIILREDQICNKCYFILKGCIRQYQLIDGEEKTTAFFIDEQAAIMYSSYLNRSPSQYYLSCVEDTILITGTREQEQNLHKKHPKLEHLIHALMTQDYLDIQERLSSLIHKSPEERYMHLMENHPELLNRVPLYQLATYIGVTPESFSRIRKRILEKQKKG